MNWDSEWLFWALLAFFLACLVWLYRRLQSKIRKERGQLFLECSHLFNACKVTQAGTRYPVLRGEYAVSAFKSTTAKPRKIHIWAFVDTLQTRRLPPLWLIVDIEASAQEAFEILVRPTGVEFFAQSDRLPFRYELPVHWPTRSILKSSVDNDQELQAMFIKANAELLPLLRDDYTKCISLSPNRLRYVVQIAQASRAHYLVMRNADFGARTLASEWMQQKLDLLFGMLDKIEQTQKEEQKV